MESNQILPVNSPFSKRNLNQDLIVQQKLKSKGWEPGASRENEERQLKLNRVRVISSAFGKHLLPLSLLCVIIYSSVNAIKIPRHN